MHGRRLIVLFFDLSSMQPEELQRAVQAAHDYVDKKLSPSDVIAVTSFSTSLQVAQDFTADRALLDAAIDSYGGANAQGFENGTTGDSEGTPDNGTAFTPDDTEFNIFNTDRRLDALQTLSDALAGIEQKKSVIYFSSGMSQNGQDNQVELRRTVDRATRANVSLYAADMRGLTALVPGGDATQASTRGVSAFSGASVQTQVSNLAGSQDTLSTMAEDTGGKAFFDSNSFGQVFDRVVADTSAYYVLGFSSTNPARDGAFPADQGAPEAHGREARISIRLLRAARLRAFDEGRSRAAAAGSADVGSVGHRSERLRLRRVFPDRGQSLSSCRSRWRCPAIRCRSRGPATRITHRSTCSASCATRSSGRWAAFATR